MRAEALRDFVATELQALAWDQWTQLGVSGARPQDREERAADPEALLLFTLNIGRGAPRLFDEVLDWLALNERLVSVHRLRDLCFYPQDRALVDAALAWATRARGRARGDAEPAHELIPLFPALPASTGVADAAFAQHGFARQQLLRSGKSRPPRFTDPIAFAFRLRRLLGVGVRAEVMRTLLTIRAPWVAGTIVSASAGFAQRNVREALTQFADAGVIDSTDDRLYSTNRDAWAAVLRMKATPDLPFHYDWIPAFRALTGLAAFLERPELDELSPYLLASQARTVIGELAPDLRFVGAPPELFTAFGADFWPAFDGIARAAIRHARTTSS